MGLLNGMSMPNLLVFQIQKIYPLLDTKVFLQDGEVTEMVIIKNNLFNRFLIVMFIDNTRFCLSQICLSLNHLPLIRLPDNYTYPVNKVTISPTQCKRSPVRLPCHT